MKRSLLAVLLLLTAASVASADYVLLMVNLSGTNSAPQGVGAVPPGGGMRGGVPPGGAGGAAGAGGAGGMRPGFGMVGGAPGAGFMGGGPPRPPTGTPDRDDSLNAIAVVVEVENIGFGDPVKKFEKRQPIKVRHPWGGDATLHPESRTGKVILLTDHQNRPIPSVHKKYLTESKRVFGGTPEIEEVRKLAAWCLAHGLVKEFTEVMDRLVEMDKKLPIAVAYMEVREALKRPPEAANVPAWVNTLLPNNRSIEKPGYHYQVIHSVEAKEAATTALEALEKNLQGYYYWWALHGKVMQLPRQMQVVLVPEKNEDFKRFSGLMTPAPIVADAFFARREGLIVMAKQRLDDRYDAMEKFASRWYDNGVSRSVVLSGKKGSLDADDLIEAQLATLVLKGLETERELNAATHDGTRQLLYASGLLPRNVLAPEWVLFGTASFFETSPESPWPGIGAASYYWLPQFKDHKETWFERTEYSTLLRIVTDTYFRNLPPRGEPGSAARRSYETHLQRARASAWGLTYFLANRKVDGLERYYKELSKLPRDMEVDETMLLLCFARAFDAVDVKGHLDEAKLTALAAEWYKYLDNTTLESQELDRQIRQYKQEIRLANSREKKPTDRPAGGGPGGNPPGGG